MFSSTQQEVFELVNNQFGNDIDLTEGGNSYIFYSVLSKLIDLSNQYGIEQLNKASVLSATGNDLNSLGFLLNRTRTYERFTLSSVNLTSSDQTGRWDRNLLYNRAILYSRLGQYNKGRF